MNKKERVFLVGLMGCGKSRVGRILAAQLAWSFLDTDTWIEKISGQTVSEIFRKQGEVTFRRLEARALNWALKQSRCVIAVGGGMIAASGNRGKLYRGGRSAYLQLSASRALKRLGNKALNSRPLLAGAHPLTVLEALLRQRRPWYTRAEITVSALGKPDRVAWRIAQRLKL